MDVSSVCQCPAQRQQSGLAWFKVGVLARGRFNGDESTRDVANVLGISSSNAYKFFRRAVSQGSDQAAQKETLRQLGGEVMKA